MTNVQSKYIALHVRLVLGNCGFIIKNKDGIKIKLDEKIIYGQLTSNAKIEDECIRGGNKICQTVNRAKKLKNINSDKNLTKKISNARVIKTKND